MFIELVDALRCPVPHEESWLVAAATRMDARHFVEGTLGCPVCGAQYPIHEGVVDFRSTRRPLPPSRTRGDVEQAMRLAAFLGLADAQGFAVLLGAWGADAPALATLVELPLLLVDPPEGITGEPGISVIRCDGIVPLAPRVARAMAIDEGDAARTASAVRATRPKGRIIAPASVSVPDEVHEIARDETMWVGERDAPASPLITLHVRRG